MANPPKTRTGASTTDVLVVGGGLAGLCAARELRKAGASVVVLEARDRVGGRTCTVQHEGRAVDLGGQWFGTTQDRVASLAQELGVDSYSQYDAGRSLLEFGGKVRSYKGTIPSLPLHALADLQWMIIRVDRMARSVPLGRAWEAKKAAQWDSTSVEAWKHRYVRTKGARASLDVAVRSIFSAEPRDLSVLYFLHYVNSAGGLMPLVDVRGGAQEFRFVGGAQTLSSRMAEALGDSVVLEAPVEAIEQGPDGVRLQTAKGSFAARFAVIAVPPHLAVRIRFEPALPALRDQLSQRMPLGSSIKFFAFYDRPFWREQGFSGEWVSNDSIVSLAFDASPRDGTVGALVAFVLGDQARQWTDRPAAERRQAILSCLARAFGPAAAEPVSTLEKDWNQDPWTRGCSVGLFATGGWTSFGSALRAPCGRLHWAGTETASRWMGFMDGAIESGQRAAVEVLERLS